MEHFNGRLRAAIMKIVKQTRTEQRNRIIAQLEAMRKQPEPYEHPYATHKTEDIESYNQAINDAIALLKEA